MAEHPSPPPGAFHVDGPVDVAVLIVTYNSAEDLPRLLQSLRAEARHLRLRVVVADNASSDGTMARVRAHPDVVALATGGNLGYAGGINAAAEVAGDARALLILNPDLDVMPGAVGTLLEALEGEDRVGIVAPRVLDEDGSPTVSLFREPGLLRALGDAALGRFWRTRPAALSEWVRTPARYASRQRVDWASGAALMVGIDAARAVGEWDERFFLYSEETDYCRRVRDAGFTVTYEPEATVRHRQGGSGSSPALDALLNVNRVRYMMIHAPRRAYAYRRIALFGAALRARSSPSHRETARVLRDPRTWRDLPRATWSGVPGEQTASFVIPAHNEEAVISRTLSSIEPALRTGSITAYVVCNGCSDRTAEVAAAWPGVTVIEASEASKTAALNAGDDAASVWPRVYLDADIVFPTSAIPALRRALDRAGVRGGRPRFEYDVDDSSPMVRAYYRARMRIPAMSEALWGAGVYAVNASGHEAVAPFPAVIADDVHADRALARDEKVFPRTAPVRVAAPQTVGALVDVLTRARRGPTQQGIDEGRSTARSLAGTIRGPVSLGDAVVFAALTIAARRRAVRRPLATWERDDSTRQQPTSTHARTVPSM